MKKATAILITFCLLAQCLVQLGMIGLYRLNKNFIAAELCENKAKPQLNCCGKCYLGKQLRNSEEGSGKGKNIPAKSLKGENPVYILPAATSLPCCVAFMEKAVENPVTTRHRESGFMTAVFHPPATPLPQA